MNWLLSTVSLGIVLFVATDLDDLLLLFGFFADPHHGGRQVVAGQFIGMAMIYAASLAASILAFAVSPALIGVLGFAPILIGLFRLLTKTGGSGGGETGQTRGGKKRAGAQGVVSVAMVTLANGGDNIATYVPVFATHSGIEVAIMGSVFGVMTALWCAVAQRSADQPACMAIVGCVGTRVLPLVLIGLGCSILWREGTLALVWG